MLFTYNNRQYQVSYVYPFDSDVSDQENLYLHTVHYNRMVISPNPNCEALEAYLNDELDKYNRCGDKYHSIYIVKEVMEQYISNNIDGLSSEVVAQLVKDRQVNTTIPHTVEVSYSSNVASKGLHIVLDDWKITIQPGPECPELQNRLHRCSIYHTGDIESLRLVIIREIERYYQG